MKEATLCEWSLRNQADAERISNSLALMSIELVLKAERPSRIHHPLRLEPPEALPAVIEEVADFRKMSQAANEMAREAGVDVTIATAL